MFYVWWALSNEQLDSSLNEGVECQFLIKLFLFYIFMFQSFNFWNYEIFQVKFNKYFITCGFYPSYGGGDICMWDVHLLFTNRLKVKGGS